MKKLVMYLVIMITVLLSGCELTDTDDGSITTEQAIELYGGSYAYVEENWQYLAFPGDDSNMLVCIDSFLSEDYVSAVILAVEEFDALDFISLSWEMSDDPDTDDIVEACAFTLDDQGYEVYDNSIVYTYYYEDDGMLGYNEYDFLNGDLYNSVIYFNLTLLEGEPFSMLEHVALHELGHTFGLDDLVEEALGEHSIMYSTDDYVSPDLLPYDIYNLEWMYDTNDEYPEE